MKVCILSDSHDNHTLMDAAIGEAVGRGAEAILHCGDLVAANTLKLLTARGIPMHLIHGNNTGDLYTLAKWAARAESGLHFYGQDAGIDLAGRRIFLVHYPHYARAMATTGEWDLVCCGHSHKAGQMRIANMLGGETLLINPGTVGGIGAPATYAFGDLADLSFEIFTVGAG